MFTYSGGMITFNNEPASYSKTFTFDVYGFNNNLEARTILPIDSFDIVFPYKFDISIETPSPIDRQVYFIG